MEPAEVLARVCYQIDRRTRQELSEGRVTSERDYMSTLSTRIRDAWANVGSAYVYSATLPGSAEHSIGGDTLIAVYDNEGTKVGLIEAKWPRIAMTPGYKWDKQQRMRGQPSRCSHFSYQIDRQISVRPEIAVAEMFLIETRPGTNSSLLDEFGSTLIMHEDAKQFDLLRRVRNQPWSNHDFWELLGFAGSRKLNLGTFVFRLVSCQIGRPIPVTNGTISLAIASHDIVIPLDLEKLTADVAETICRDLGIARLLLLGVDWIGDLRP